VSTSPFPEAPAYPTHPVADVHQVLSALADPVRPGHAAITSGQTAGIRD